MRTRNSYGWGAALFLITTLWGTQIADATSIWEETITLYSPYWDAKVDAAGYGDEFYWDYSP